LKWIGRVLLRAFAVVGVLLVIAIVAFAMLGHTAFGNQFLADQIASRISTQDMQIRIVGARGLLSGNFRIDRISVADTKGPFAEVEDVAIDWSPLDLLGADFDASRIAAAKLNIVRAPVQTIERAPSEGSFNLPVSVDIRKIEVPSLLVGKELLGRSAEIALSGSAKGAADLLALTLDARQKDSGNARAVADLAYAVNAETLKLNLDVSEPKGGLLATMLNLPDEPAIDISVSGDGPLDSWVGKIRARLDGIDRLALDGSHIRNEAGVHQVVLSGGGSLSGLLPPTLRTLFEGETAIDVDASF
jgi:translocation and assembly module TamB